MSREEDMFEAERVLGRALPTYGVRIMAHPVVELRKPENTTKWQISDGAWIC